MTFKITPRGLSLTSASVRVEMSGEYPTSVRSELVDVREVALRVQVGDGDAGPRDREPSPDFSEGRARTMYDRIAGYIEDVRTSFLIDVSDSVYARCMEALYSAMCLAGCEHSPTVKQKEEKQQQKQPLPMARATKRSGLPFPLCGLAAHGSSTPTGGLREDARPGRMDGGRDL